MGTIFDKVNFIINPIKSRIGEEISKKGQIITPTDPFQSYADKIKAISTDATAVTDDILSGKTAYCGGSKITGAMTNRGAVSSTLTSQSQTYTVAKGYHSGSGTVKTNISNLTAANIKQGVSVGGVVGTLVPGPDGYSGTLEIGVHQLDSEDGDRQISVFDSYGEIFHLLYNRTSTSGNMVRINGNVRNSGFTQLASTSFTCTFKNTLYMPVYYYIRHTKSMSPTGLKVVYDEESYSQYSGRRVCAFYEVNSNSPKLDCR